MKSAVTLIVIAFVEPSVPNVVAVIVVRRKRRPMLAPQISGNERGNPSESLTIGINQIPVWIFIKAFRCVRPHGVWRSPPFRVAK